MALIARLAMLPFAHISKPALWEYGMLARQMIAGHGYSYSWSVLGSPYVVVPSALMPPGGAFVEYFFLAFFGDGLPGYLALFFFQVICGVAFVYVGGLIVREMFASERYERIARWSLALFPPFVYASATFGIASETLLLDSLIVLFASRMYTALKNGRRLFHSAFLLGIGSALLGLFRAETPLILVAILLLVFTITSSPMKRRVQVATLVTGLFLFSLTPWTIRNYHIFHQFIPTSTSGGLNLWKGNNEEATGSGWTEEGFQGPNTKELLQTIPNGKIEWDYELRLSRVLTKSAVSWIQANPARVAVLAVRKIMMLWVFDWYNPTSAQLMYKMMAVAVLLLGMIGVLRYRKQETSTFAARIIGAWCIVFTLTSIVFFVIPRYQIFLMGICWPFVVLGLEQVLTIAGRINARAK